MTRVALAQVNIALGDFDANTAAILRAIRAAGDAGAVMVVFPELAVTGYPPEDLLYKPAFLAAARKALERIARKTGAVAAIVGFPREAGGCLYNSAAVLQNGEIRHIEDKKELPNYGVFDEKRYFTPGDGGTAVNIRGVNTAITICEDIWVPDGRAMGMCSRPGTDLIVNLSSSPYHMGKTALRRKVAGAWAGACGAPLAYCNLVGGQDELIFDGGSFVCDPSGGVIASAHEFREDLLVADIPLRGDPARTANRMAPPLDYPEDAFEALKLGVRDYVEKNGFKTVIIALSGGVDSALTAHIAVAALGRDRVRGVAMPSRFSSGGSVTDARELADNLGVALEIIPITGLMDEFAKALKPLFGDLPPGLAEENIQARIRGTLIMGLSNKFGHLVLTTGNKSEMGVGYCTLYGDMAGGFALIKDLPKTGVYDLCRWINGRADLPRIPQSIIDKPPSAELRPDQKDSDSLPEYPVLDPVLKLYVEEEKSIEEIIALGYDERVVRRIADLVGRSEYKRRQTAPGVRITPKAFGKDRRVPITNRFKDWVEEDT